MTWNLWRRFGPWQERRKVNLTVLTVLRPDAVAPQEARAADREDLAGWLPDVLP